jgi:hypothetical protein
VSEEPQPEFGPWGPPLRVKIEHAPVWLFALALKDHNPIYASEKAAKAAGFDAVPTTPTFNFVMTHGEAFPDIQPPGSTGSLFPPPAGDGNDLPADGVAETGLYLHGEQHFTYHRTPLVGDLLEARMRTSKPMPKESRRGTMQLTYMQTEWRDVTNDEPVVTSQIVSVYLPGG